MLNGKFVSANEVIRRVYRDSGMSSELSYADSVEWAVDCLDLINCPRSFRDEVALVTIEDYKGKLPCNYRQMIHTTGATENGLIFDMSYSENTFHPTRNIVNGNVNLSTQGTLGISTVAIDTTNPIGVDQAGNPVFNYINSETNISFPGNLAEGVLAKVPSQAEYKLNDSHIFTSFRDGYALISYNAYPFDCDGFPLVPDNIKFKLALQWYIQERIDYILWRTGSLTDKVWQTTSKERDFYMGAAQNEGKMPNIDNLESMRVMFTKIIQRPDLHNKAFSK